MPYTTNAERLAAILEDVSFALGESKNILVTESLRRARASLLEVVNEQAAASAGKTNAAKVFARIIKTGKKSRPEMLGGTWLDDQGRQCVCDGFRAFRMAEEIPAEKLPDGGERLKLHQVMDGLNERESFELDVPTAAQVRAYILYAKAAEGKTKSRSSFRCPWYFESAGVMVESEYLADLLTVMPDAKLFCDASSEIGPVYATSAKGDAVIMPIHPAKGFDAGKCITRQEESRGAAPVKSCTPDELAAMLTA